VLIKLYVSTSSIYAKSAVSANSASASVPASGPKEAEWLPGWFPWLSGGGLFDSGGGIDQYQADCAPAELLEELA
jgi:hypothetical protein